MTDYGHRFVLYFSTHWNSLQRVDDVADTFEDVFPVLDFGIKERRERDDIHRVADGDLLLPETAFVHFESAGSGCATSA